MLLDKTLPYQQHSSQEFATALKHHLDTSRRILQQAMKLTPLSRILQKLLQTGWLRCYSDDSFGESMDYKFKPHDRVRRLPFTVTIPKNSGTSFSDGETEVETTTYSARGCVGTVKALREETTLAAAESRAKSLMVLVQWDNGTLSYHGPESLEVT